VADARQLSSVSVSQRAQKIFHMDRREWGTISQLPTQRRHPVQDRRTSRVSRLGVAMIAKLLLLVALLAPILMVSAGVLASRTKEREAEGDEDDKPT
jgi:uncharacterized membrane protein